MARFEILNNVDHQDLRVITDRSAALGDDVQFVPTFPSEFRNLQRHYPIVFLRHSQTRKVMAAALLGVEEGENLFLGDAGWDVSYVPLNIQRQPFLVGFQDQEDFGQTVREPVVSIDRDSPRVSEERGEALFLEHGGSSEFLEHVSSLLKVLHEGSLHAEAFYETLDALDLLESFVLDVQLDDGEGHRLAGFETINEDVLAKLEDEQVVDLARRGYLEAIYMVIASMSHLSDLLERKTRRLADAATDG